MLTDEYKNQHEKLKRLVAMSHKDRIAEVEMELREDMEEEAEFELDIDLSPVKRFNIPLPSNDTVVSYKPDGTPLSWYGDNRWTFIYNHTEKSIGFGLVHKQLGLDLSSDLCTPLVGFHKVICFFRLPGKDPRVLISSPGSTVHNHKGLLQLCSLFKERGYLYGRPGEFAGLDTLSVDVLRKEILDRISRDEGFTRVVGLAQAIGAWISVSSFTELPPEYLPSFSASQFWGNGLAKKITQYYASKKRPRDVIAFGDLIQMFKTAAKYMNYVDDALFIGKIFSQLHDEDIFPEKRGGHIELRPDLLCTKGMVKEIMERQYAIDPDTGKAWLEPRLTPGGIVEKTYLRKKVMDVVTAAIFLLFIWSAMRRDELRILNSEALFVNGEPLDPGQNAIVQVRQGTIFSLERVVTKTNKELLGKQKELPLPRSGAEAFAFLKDLYHSGRQQTLNTFLLPTGDFGHAQGRNYTPGKHVPVSSTTIYELFRGFCRLAGVKLYAPHRCRKTIATILINHDPKCIELIRDLLCHENIEMTRDYLMRLPGIAEEARKLFVAGQSEAIVEIITSAIEGKFAGPAGDRSSEAILDNIDAFKGKRLPQTIAVLEETLIKSNFIVVRTPAAWCLRFPASVPWDAPCLPSPSKRQRGEIPVPNFEKCQDWLCKFSGYTPSDIERAKDAKMWAMKKSAESISGASRAYFDELATYWDRIIDQLEHGRPDILDLNLAESFLSEAGAHA